MTKIDIDFMDAGFRFALGAIFAYILFIGFLFMIATILGFKITSVNLP